MLALPATTADGRGTRARLGLKLHLLVCGWCRKYLRELHRLNRVQREQPEDLGAPKPGTWSEEARRRVVRALFEAGSSASTVAKDSVARTGHAGSDVSARGGGGTTSLGPGAV